MRDVVHILLWVLALLPAAAIFVITAEAIMWLWDTIDPDGVAFLGALFAGIAAWYKIGQLINKYHKI